jgi:hypothetical protein
MFRSLKVSLAVSLGLLSVAAHAGSMQSDAQKAKKPFADLDHVIYSTARGIERPSVSILAGGANLKNHGGPVITGAAKVVFIFWGPSFSGGSDAAYAASLQAFRTQFGTTGEYKTITEYSGIPLNNLGAGTADWFDTSTPPTNVTDAIVQSKVNSYLTTHTFDANTVYEVVIPSSSYSSSGSSTSCGGPSLAYCAYHGWIGSGTGAIKYSIEPYPSCGGCQVSGWTAVQNQEHFVCHETREAVTDPTGQGWWDNSGQEADDKCAWSPSPFLGTGGFGYQYEWSNAARGCIKVK